MKRQVYILNNTTITDYNNLDVNDIFLLVDQSKESFSGNYEDLEGKPDLINSPVTEQNVTGNIVLDTANPIYFWILTGTTTITGVTLPPVGFARTVYIQTEGQAGTESIGIPVGWKRAGELQQGVNTITLLVFNSTSGVKVTALINQITEA